MAEKPETGGDPQTDPKQGDPAPVTPIVGTMTTEPNPPKDPQKHIEDLNRENATRRLANQTLTTEKAALQQRLDDLEATMKEEARKTELGQMEETERLRAEKVDAEQKAEARVQEANETLKRATVMGLASQMDLINVPDAVAVIDLSQIPVLNGVADTGAAQALLDAALATRSHWQKSAAPPTPVPSDPGPGNPAPDDPPGGPLPSYRPGDDPLVAVKKANADYREGKTSMPQMVHAYNKSWERSKRMRDGSMFPDPTRSLKD